MTTEMKPILLIDLSALFRAAFHANENGPTGITFQTTLDGVRRARNTEPDSLVAICCDGKGNWRKELSPDYKAHRERQPESMYGQLDKVKAQLAADGYLLWTADGYEADDVIATATAKAREAGHDVLIASHDKDVAQLISPNVRMLVTSTWEIRGEAEVVAKFGVEPASIGDFLALTGDKSDGIRGVPSVGPVTARELLIKHGDLFGIFRKVEALKVHEGKDGGPQCETTTEAAKAIATPAIVDKLWRHKGDALLARKLVELKTDAPIEFSDIYKEREVKTTVNSSNVDLDNVDDLIVGAKKPDQKKPECALCAEIITRQWSCVHRAALSKLSRPPAKPAFANGFCLRRTVKCHRLRLRPQLNPARSSHTSRSSTSTPSSLAPRSRRSRSERCSTSRGRSRGSPRRSRSRRR